MTQMTFGLDPLPKKTRKEVFLDEMNRVVPWGELVSLIQPRARGAHQALGGRPPFAIETMLRIHCLRLWWNLGDPGDGRRFARAAAVPPPWGTGRRCAHARREHHPA